MNTLTYYWNSFMGYWPTARALSRSLFGACLLFFILLSIPIRKHAFGRHPRKIVLFLQGEKIPFFVRDGTDISALREIFAHAEYVFGGLSALSPKHILDIGAHIGTATLFFHAQYPDARITAYEPDPENFKLLTLNLGRVPGVTLVNAAVAPEAGTISFYPNKGGSTRASIMRVSDSSEKIQVTAESIATVLGQGAELVKFDVEGAEVGMFAAASPELLGGVERYMGEVHHKLIGKTQKEFEHLFPGFSFVWKSRGADHSIVSISRP